MTKFEIPGFLAPEPNRFSGGQPTPEQLRAAATAGLRRVINLRPPNEDAGYDEAALARELGLDYRTLPVAGPSELTREKVTQLDAWLAESPGPPTLIHCASGNRVGALMALREAWLKGQPAERALSVGRAWGLTKLEAIVRQLLQSA